VESKPAYTNAELDAEYTKLNPPRRGYQDYWASKQADEDMKHVPQGMSDFFRVPGIVPAHGAAKATAVRGNHVIARGGEGRHHLAPAITQVWKTVNQEHQRPA